MNDDVTPMMRQYRDAKAQSPDALLLFRMGDFYELFHDDAREAARILSLTLTSRDKGPNATPMAGFPYHALDMHLRKLLEAGKRVAICDQVENPKDAVGLVKREVTRVVSPGTLTDENLLDPRSNNFLVAIAPAKGSEKRDSNCGIAWLDLSAGRLTAGVVDSNDVASELGRLEPAEVLHPDDRPPKAEWFLLQRQPALTPRPAFEFSQRNAEDLLRRQFNVATFEGYGFDADSLALAAAGALVAYLLETQKTGLSHISKLAPYRTGQSLVLDPTTRRSLELTRTLRENRREGSLLDAIDKTVTSCGARRLAEWLSQPLVEIAPIRHRQAAVAEWKEDPSARSELRDLLKQTFDVERLVGRIATGRTHPRDLAALRETLRLLPAIKAKLAGRDATMNAEIEQAVDLFPGLRQRLETTLVDEPPFQIQAGGIVRDGFSVELDELREIAKGGKQWMANFQRQQAEETGIANLKVGFNKVFGFYLEVTNTGKNKVPADWQRKQTIKNAERYITPDLKEHERKVLHAEDRANSLETELFAELRAETANHMPALQRLAAVLGDLDCLLGLAELAATRHYVRPQITDGVELTIEAGRHPVLDTSMQAGRFIPNDTKLNETDGRFLLITGPNMAGKSTYIRQVALIVVLAQIGGFVPAASATIGVADRVFARVGASDELGRGQSTFMVEMTESANILNNATARSLVILDEIGRGTSTYDGVSLAWAISEHLHDRVRCRTLFATHYHELIDLEKTLTGLRNRNVAVREWKDEIIFLHQIVEGGADRSYGIHVARLAGVPAEVLQRAQDVLFHLERDPFGDKQVAAPATSTDAMNRPKKHRRAYHQLSLFPLTTAHPILDELRTLDDRDFDGVKAREMLLAWKRRLEAEE